MENGKVVSNRDFGEDGEWDESARNLLEDFKKEKLVLGKEYNEELSVQNSGTIETYVRVILNKSWSKGEGENALKDTTLSPELIDLNLPKDSLHSRPIRHLHQNLYCLLPFHFPKD